MSEGKKKLVEAITAQEVDFTQWYTDICLKAELVDYSSVKGCMIIKPYGYAIWENIQSVLDKKFKELGHENVSTTLDIYSHLFPDQQQMLVETLEKLNRQSLKKSQGRKKAKLVQ